MCTSGHLLFNRCFIKSHAPDKLTGCEDDLEERFFTERLAQFKRLCPPTENVNETPTVYTQDSGGCRLTRDRNLVLKHGCRNPYWKRQNKQCTDLMGVCGETTVHLIFLDRLS